MDQVDYVARRCVGGVLIGLPRWKAEMGGVQALLPTEYCHYEGAVLRTLGLPLLVLAGNDVERRCVFDHGAGYFITGIPSNVGESWLHGPEFTSSFDLWVNEVNNRDDIFLGYCSTSAGVARNLKRFIERELGASVLDWHEDFYPGTTILEQIARAAALCSAGIFLFTRDDQLQTEYPENAAPRDNVVFEAGYFAHAKGHDRILIVREINAKMPADLGGQIFAMLQDRTDIAPIEAHIRKFISKL